MCRDPSIQTKLRDELINVSTDMPTFDEINALPYLDAVVRETLRVYAPVPGMVRVASEDCHVPLAKPFIDTNGRKHDQLL